MIARLSVCMALLSAAACSTLPDRASIRAGEAARADRQIVVTVPQSRQISTALLGAPESRYQRHRGYRAAPAVERILDELAREHGLTRIEGWPIGSLDVYCEVFEVAPGTAVEPMLDRLSQDPRVRIAQRMNLFETLSSRYDDTYVELQTALPRLEIESAHELATGRGITIAVIDSGVDARHPELRDRIVLSRNLVDGLSMPRDGEIHGTAVAGVIGSRANNAEGIVGVAPDASIITLRACWSATQLGAGAICSTFSLAKALELALTLEPQVVNLSLTGPHDPLLAQLLDRVTGSGIVVVTARPERLDTNSGFPASQPNVIVAQSSLRGRALRAPNLLVAPAHEILTTVPAAGYAFLSGDSLAAAHVSGIAALLIEQRPQMSVAELTRLLRDSEITVAGRTSVNACRALATLTGGAGCVARVEVVSRAD